MRRTREAINAMSGAPDDGLTVLRAMCEDAAENLDADLVSVWRFDEGQEKIRCLCAFDAPADSFTGGQELFRKDFPTYFAAVVEENIVCAPDARTHPKTRELTEAYFEPHGIVSLLDFVVHQDFQPVGIICCESRAKRRDWSDADRTYLRSLVTLASLKARLGIAS